ncbi:MAG: helix-turn-helix transcriptional regulator [Vicinamibacterales bacterium]
MPRDPQALLPLKPLVFHLLVALLDGERHGWALLRAVEDQPGAERLMPGQLYRQLAAMLDEGLIDERDTPGGGQATAERVGRTGGAAPRRFFRLTPFGRAVTRAEARRLEGLVADTRVRRLLSRRRS